MTIPFAAPATPTGLDLKSLLGSLLLIDVHAQETGITTSYGPSDAIRADVAVLDGPTAGETYQDTLIFPKVLQSQLRSRVGGKVLGRLSQGQAKPGQSAPWVLDAANDADQQLGLQWVNRTQSPAAPAAPAQQQSVPQQQAAAAAPPWAQ